MLWLDVCVAVGLSMSLTVLAWLGAAAFQGALAGRRWKREREEDLRARREWERGRTPERAIELEWPQFRDIVLSHPRAGSSACTTLHRMGTFDKHGVLFQGSGGRWYRLRRLPLPHQVA